MEIGGNNGMVIGQPLSERKPPVESEGQFKAFVMKNLQVLCYMEVITAEGKVLWEYPLILESIVERDQETGQINRSQAFRPLTPLTKDTKFIPLNCDFLCSVEDEKMKSVYTSTIQTLRMQMSGIALPKTRPAVGKIIT